MKLKNVSYLGIYNVIGIDDNINSCTEETTFLRIFSLNGNKRENILDQHV